MKVRDAHAERLEAAGLYRRAANAALHRMGLPAGGQHEETINEDREDSGDET